jgi:hypothetical protein
VGWVYYGYNVPTNVALNANWAFETTDPKDIEGPSSYPDYLLGIAGVALGQELAEPEREPVRTWLQYIGFPGFRNRRPLQLKEVGDWIRVKLGSVRDKTLSPVPNRAFFETDLYPFSVKVSYGQRGRDLPE